jgi:hypothetical protein
MLASEPASRPEAREVERLAAEDDDDGAAAATETATVSTLVPGFGPEESGAQARLDPTPMRPITRAGARARPLVLGALVLGAGLGSFALRSAWSPTTDATPSVTATPQAPRHDVGEVLASAAKPFLIRPLIKPEKRDRASYFLEAGLADPRTALRWDRFLNQLSRDLPESVEAPEFWDGVLLDGLVETLESAAKLRRRVGDGRFMFGSSDDLSRTIDRMGLTDEQAELRSAEFLARTEEFLAALPGGPGPDLLRAAWVRPLLAGERSEEYRRLFDELIPAADHHAVRGAVYRVATAYLRDPRADWVAPCAQRRRDYRTLRAALERPGTPVRPEQRAWILGTLANAPEVNGCRWDDPFAPKVR